MFVAVCVSEMKIVDITIENVDNDNRGINRKPRWIIFKDGFNLHFDYPVTIARFYNTKRQALNAFNVWKSENVK